MARGRKRSARRRNDFVALHSLGNADQQYITHLIDRTKHREASTSKHSSIKQKEAAEQEAAEQEAAQIQNSVTEIILFSIPRTARCTEIVMAIVRELRRQKAEPVHRPWNDSAIANPHILSDCPVIRCEIRRRNLYRRPNAIVLLETPYLAELLVRASTLNINNFPVKVDHSKYPTLPGIGGAWRTRPDPGSRRWKVDLIQLGRRLDHASFSCLWQSTPFTDVSEDSIVEINPITHVIAVIVGREQKMRQAQPNLLSYSWSSAMLRIEIPFRDIQTEPLGELLERPKHKTALYLSFSRSPRLFRAEAPQLNLIAPFTYNVNDIWDHKAGYLEEVRWVRTVDPTLNCAFGAATWIRLTMSSDNFSLLFVELHKKCIATSPEPRMIASRIEKETKSGDTLPLFNDAKLLNISFEIRYSVACLLSFGLINPSSVTVEFWHVLAEDLDDDDAYLVLRAMYEECSSGEVDSIDIDPIVLLRQCMELCNVRTRHDNSDRSHDGSMDESSSRESGTSSWSPSRLPNKELELETLIKRLSLNGQDATDTSEILSERENSGRRLKKKSNHVTHVRRLLLTPTKCLALPPEEDLLNRVLRHFADFKDRFLRVSFTDEDYGYVGYTGSTDLAARIRIALRDGIEVAGERFVFLAFSNSQLRDHGVWMYNETQNLSTSPPSADEIRHWMGTFSHIRVPAKFAARQGQVFSSTVGTVVIDEGHQTTVPDVLARAGGYIFSDGVGTISSKLADKVTRRLRLSRVPSAFQIRFGGAKGILTVWNQALQPGIDIALRPSMRKFESEHRVLEIVGYSKRLPAYLNRQVITVLSTMGVPDEVFVKKLDRVLYKLNCAMTAKGGLEALDLLYAAGHHDSGLKLRASSSMMSAARFFQAGLTCASCEHLFNMMNAFRRRMIKDLTSKARIPIESDKGVCLFGIMDELGVLDENEVFCQLTEPHSGQDTIVTGPVLVGRSPCMHPGDIQLLNARDHLCLRHLRDVIVFPRRGVRPIPSMLSGGDLDGDIFFCLFDDDLTRNVRRGNFPAMNYTSKEPASLDRDVETRDVASFFVEYIMNDRLGQIANAHLVYSDKEKMGIQSANCLQLAELHSVAVDFAKTGVPAEYPRSLILRNTPEQFPDFFGKHRRVSYKSRKVLGKLYRACSTGKRYDCEQFRPSSKSWEVDAIIDSIPLEPSILKKASVACQAYNYDLNRIMEEFGVQTEGEVVSGEVLSFTRRHAELRSRKDFDLRIRLNRRASELKNGYRRLFYKDLPKRDNSDINEQIIIKACAWHRACREIAAVDRRDGIVGKVSFPWVVADVLLRVIQNQMETKARTTFMN